MRLIKGISRARCPLEGKDVFQETLWQQAVPQDLERASSSAASTDLCVKVSRYSTYTRCDLEVAIDRISSKDAVSTSSIGSEKNWELTFT